MDNNVKEQAILIGYWPLISPQDYCEKPGSAIDMSEQSIGDLVERLENTLPNGEATSCLWMLLPDKETSEYRPSPVLVIERAKEIAEHIAAWSDFSVESRFELLIPWNKADLGEYSVILMPLPDQSIDRYNMARKLNGEPTNDMDYTVVFKPLRFGTKSGSCFANVYSKLPSVVTLHLLDPSSIAGSDTTIPIGARLAGLDSAAFFSVGQFPVRACQKGPSVYSGRWGRYVTEYMDNLEKSAKGESWVNPVYRI